MDYKIIRNVRAAARASGAPSLPLRNLEIAKEVNGELVGDALFIPGKTLKQINPSVRKQAKAAEIDVALRTDKDGKGVYVFRIRKEKPKGRAGSK
jgi:hypothetical protein